ncbi:hypothetical protein A1Q1_08095 [Trichosporon asahii var. asahii CBS 2479]|uniref:C2 domain-containing protein n=1 Tax=Trichosporon asahii var. asahii (strain ATCC 90039 / CBS 2479 / JCM 2466 / KCTC 7840 / NBRC 103889/ NCYC 2677 / UAMH 7654) TaxID=1186058 RepID=J6F1E0_TRIAS|nr:hypothetical protein A1Q1_08095 [Trichosporon asahii var. asahii CBS 2479]EJT50769.1 hypothetical protein A1Q1_08095 [Trichosporon asahii var. asahii CBS 2479]
MGKDKKNPPGGLDKTPMPPSVGETYTLKVTFHGATNLPPADWGDSADPFILAQINTPLHTRNKHDPHVRFRSATSYKTLDPRWEAVWVVAGIPTPGAEFKIRVYDEDSGSHDDELGKVHVHTGRLSADYVGLDRQTFDLSSRGASVKAWGRKACMKPFSSDARKDETITISIENLGRTNPEVGKVYTANSFYWVHFSAILGHITDTVAPDPDAGGTEDPDFQANELQLAGPAPNALYHRYVEFLPFVKTMFQAKHLRGKLMHELLHREHEKVYHFDPKTRYGTLRNGHERARRFLDMAHWGEGDRVFTYVVTLDGLMRFTETGPEFGIDMLSKHTMHSDVDEWICVSGEFFIRKYKPGDPDGDMVKGVTSSVGDDKAQGIKPAVEKDIQQLKINTQYDGGDSEGGNGEEGERRGPMEVKSPSEVGMPSRSGHKRSDSRQSGYYTPPEYDEKPGVAAVVGGHRKSNSASRGGPNAAGPEFGDDGQPRASDEYRGHQRTGSNWGAESQRTITRDGPNGSALGNTVNDFPTPPNVDRSTTATPGHANATVATGAQTPAAYNAQPGSGALVGPNVPASATGPDGLPTSNAIDVFGGAPIDGNGLKGRRGYIATRTVETELPNGRRIVETSRVEVVHRKGEPPQEHREFERHEISPKPRALPLPPDGKPDGPLSPSSRKMSLPSVPGSPGTTPGVMSPGLSGMGSPTLSAVAAPIAIQSVTTPGAGEGAHIEEINDEDDKPNGVKGIDSVPEARLRDPKQSARVNRPPSHASVHGSMHESMYAGIDNRASGASFEQRPSTDNRRSTDRRQSTDRRKSTDKPSSPVAAMSPVNGGESRPRSLAGPEHHYHHPGSDGSSVSEDQHLHDAHLDVNGHPQSAFREDGDILLAQQRKNKNPLLSTKLDKHAARHQRDKPSTAPQLPPQQQSSVRVPLTTEALEHHNSMGKKGSPTSPKKSSPKKDKKSPTTDADAIKASLIPQAPAKKRDSSGYKIVDNPRYSTSQGQLASAGNSPEKPKGPQHQPLLGAGGQPIGRVAEHPPQVDVMSLNTTPEFVERDPHGKTVGVLTGPAKPSALELSDSDDDVPQGGFLVYTNERDGKPVEADPYGEKARKRAEEARKQAEEDERQRQADEKAAQEAEKERQRQAKIDAKQSKKDRKAQEKQEKQERKQREKEEKEERKQREREQREQADAVQREKEQKQRQEQEKAKAAQAMRENAETGERARANSMEKAPVPGVQGVGVGGGVGAGHKAAPHGKTEPHEHHRHKHERHDSARKEKHVHPVETNWILGPENGGSTDPSDYQLIIDNDSGTYRPDKQIMPLFEAWLRQEFPGLHVMAMSCDDDRLQNMKKKRQEKKKERNKGRVWERRGSHGSMSSISSSDEDDIEAGRAPVGKKEKRFDFLEHPGQTLREKVKQHGDTHR